jgi:hypothetical protein
VCVCVYYVIVVCIDGKKYITGNEPQRDTEISVGTVVLIYFCVCSDSHKEAEHAGVSICVSTGCQHARQT